LIILYSNFWNWLKRYALIPDYMVPPQNVLPQTGEGRLTFMWILFYLALHGLTRQIVSGPYIFVCLRLLFIGLIACYLFTRGEAPIICKYFLGKILPANSSWRTVLFCFFILLLCRILIEILNPFPMSFTAKNVLDNCVIAPFNEEIVFRGIFLTILVEEGNRPYIISVLMSALVFASCHELVGVFQMMVLTLQGSLYGLIFVASRSVPTCILCHVVWNSVSLWN